MSMAVVAEFSSTQSPAIKPSPSSLLTATPASIVRALSVAYPLLCFADRILGWLTWSSSDKYESFLILILFTLLTRNIESVIRYWLPLAIATGISILMDQTNLLHRRKPSTPPTLDDIVAKLESSGLKFRAFVSPLKGLRLSGMEAIRFILATILVSPIYATIIYLWVTPRNLILSLGIIVLSWHSIPFKVARSVAWSFSIVRVLVFLITGIDRTSTASRKGGRKSRSYGSQSTADDAASISSFGESQEVEYTFVLYENQRHWLGIGWTSNLLPEERAAWTDPSLNEVASIESFELPDASGTGMAWRWVDEAWQLDVKGDGSLIKKNPGENEGFVYYNNLWSSPSPVSSFSKYTRRRRWIRKAALASIASHVSEVFDLSEAKDTISAITEEEETLVSN